MDIFTSILNTENFIYLFLVKYGLFLSLLFLLPYFSIVIGTFLFSIIHTVKGNKRNELSYLLFSNYLSQLVLKRIWVRLIFGFVPFIGILIFFSILNSNNIPSSPVSLLISFILFTIGIYLYEIYRNSINRKILIIQENDNDGKNKIKPNISFQFAWLGLLLLILSSFLLISALQASIDPNLAVTDTSLNILFSANSIIYFLLFITLTFSITSAIIAARLNRAVEKYVFKNYASDFAIKTGMIFTFILPLIYLVTIFSMSSSALSFSYFVSSMIVLLLMLIISILFYLKYRKNNLKSTTVVFIFLLLFSFLIYSSQMTSELINKKEMIKKGNNMELFS